MLFGGKVKAILLHIWVDTQISTSVHESEATEDAKLLYVLHNDSFFMEVSPKRIVEETKKDKIMQTVI